MVRVKVVRTVAALANAWARHNKNAVKLSRQPHIFGPALEAYMEGFNQLQNIAESTARDECFRHWPSFEGELMKRYASLTPVQRTSLAQQARASKPRIKVTRDGKNMRHIVRTLISRDENRGKIAKVLWPAMINHLTDLGLHPICNNTSATGEAVEYDAGAFRKRLSERRFANIVSSLRQEEL